MPVIPRHRPGPSADTDSMPWDQMIPCHHLAARKFAASFYRKYAMTSDIGKAVSQAVIHGTGQDPEIRAKIHLFYKGKRIFP